MGMISTGCLFTGGQTGQAEVLTPTLAKPSLAVSEQGNNIVVRFDNPRETDGVEIWSRRGTETEYKFLAKDTESPYFDNRANLVAGVAEERKYKAWFFDNDDLIGLESDEVSISITK